MGNLQVPPADERERKSGVIRLISLGFAVPSILAILIWLVIWLFNRDFPVMPVQLITATMLATSLISYGLARGSHNNIAGYLLTGVLLLVVSVAVYLFGGVVGPLAILYILAILIASLIISLRSAFLMAAVSSVSLFIVTWLELAGAFPQVIEGKRLAIMAGSGDAILLYIALTVDVIVFFLVAFLSWFAASRLERALQVTRRYAAELQGANEKLQASEEELRAANEELEASNEELRATEEELRASNDELKEAQEQLVRSEKLAAIGQLAGGVGHELRNPLGAIKNAVYYIRGKIINSEFGRQEPRVAQFLDIVDDEITSSNKIINDLLSFSRVGKPAASSSRIEMVIDDAVAHTHIPEEVELVKDLDADLPEIMVDTDQIRQVFVNIMTNAVQAMPEGGKLTVNSVVEDSWLATSFTDTGSGIPEDAIKKIFDPLFTMKAKGIGLGLAVCRSIVERHGGSIEVKSRAGEGTTFTVKLPLKAG